MFIISIAWDPINLILVKIKIVYKHLYNFFPKRLQPTFKRIRRRYLTFLITRVKKLLIKNHRWCFSTGPSRRKFVHILVC